MQSAPSQEAAPPLPDGDPQQLPPPLPGEDWRQHNSAAAPPLPEEPPPLPQPGPSGAAPWAAPPGSGQQPGLTGSQPAPLAAPPWAAQQQGMQAPLPHTQQPPWSAHGAYPGHAHPGTYQQQQPAAPSPYAQMYGQAWAGQPPGMQQHHHHQAYAGAPAYPAPGYANLYPATPYQVGAAWQAQVADCVRCASVQKRACAPCLSCGVCCCLSAGHAICRRDGLSRRAAAAACVRIPAARLGRRGAAAALPAAAAA
jgi:hypothetical protein